MDTGVIFDSRYFEVLTGVQARSNKSTSLDTATKETEEQVDKLYFMETFDFPGLGELKTSLLESKELTPEQVEKVISGLATLPEYRG